MYSKLFNSKLPEWCILARNERPTLSFSSSEWRKGSSNSSLADNRSEASAMHFSMNDLTSVSATFANDAGFTPYQKETFQNNQEPVRV